MNTLSIVLAVLATVAFTSASEIKCSLWWANFDPINIEASIKVNNKGFKHFFFGKIGGGRGWDFNGETDFASTNIKNVELQVENSPKGLATNIFQCFIDEKSSAQQMKP